MIIQKTTVLMLTIFSIFANAEEISKQDGQLRNTNEAETVGFTGTKVDSSDGNPQGTELSAIKRSWKTLK